MDIKVRFATSIDLDTIINFQKQMALETENMELDPKKIRKGVDMLLKDSSRGKYIIAEVKKKPIGCTMITPEWSDWRGGWFLWLQSVYIVKEFRNTGAFKSILSNIKEIVNNGSDYLGLRLYVFNENKDAINVYKKLGFSGGHYEFMEWEK